MPKDNCWFTHDANFSQDPRVIALIADQGLEGYGRYWLLIEYLRTQDGYRYSIASKFSMPSLSSVLKADVDRCSKFKDTLVDFELLCTDGAWIWSPDLNEKMVRLDETKKKMSERGKKGAQATNAKKSAQAKNIPGTSDDKSGTSEKNTVQNPAQDIIEQDIIEQESINKTEKKKPATPFVLKEEVIYPFKSENFINEWQRWKKYKKIEHRFNYKSADSENTALKNLAEISVNDEATAIKIIDQAIGGGWKGLFQLKPTYNGSDKIPFIGNSVRTGTSEARLAGLSSLK